MKLDMHFDDHAYHSTLDELEAIARTFDPAAPDDLRSRLIETLGGLGVWPASILNGTDEGKAAVAA